MSTRANGCLVLLGIVVVAAVFCGIIPFVIMPGLGVGVGMPVITVPGEVLQKNFLPGLDLTNTIVGGFLAMILVLVFIFLAWRASKGWTKEVPGRFQGWVEFFIGGFYNFMKSIGGERLRTAPYLWPLIASIFIFLLAANWLKLLPGVESVGKMHCAHVGFNGYPAVQGITDNSYTLFVDGIFDAGTPQSEEAEHACEYFFVKKEFTRFPMEDAEAILPQVEEARAALRDAQIVRDDALNALNAAAEAQRAEAEAALAKAEEAVAKAERALERQEIRLESAEAIAGLRARLDDVNADIRELEGQPEAAAGDHGEGAPAEAKDVEGQLAALQNERDILLGELNRYRTQMQYPTATITLTQEQLDAGAWPFLFHITPFVRGAATDLSLTFGLALLSIVLVQAYGVWAQGPAYFEKFVNISALGNLRKKPLGAIDFVVGLIEIISEIGKIVSLAFRLFGNLFAGGVALIALTFLVAAIVPMIMYLLEIIIGTVQALVFAVLTLVFAAQAMESHHGDDHEHAADH